MTPVYVDPFLGAGGVWLSLLGAHLVPPVSWMGGKRRLAPRLLELLDLHPGQREPMVLGDASWWGWVWPLCLDPVTGPQVCAWLRAWRGEEPRALWFRLRDAGPPADLVERAAGLLWLQARAASGVPVWWEGDEIVSVDGHGRGPYRAWQSTGLPKLVQWTATRVDAAGQRQATEPRLLASDGRGKPREAGHKADKSGEDNRTGGMVDPGTIAIRLDAGRQACAKGFNREGFGGMVNPATIADGLKQTRARLVMATRTSPKRADMGSNDGHREKHGWRAFEPSDVAARVEHARVEHARGEVTIEHRDALDLVREWAPVLGSRARIYLDPPYQGATGYPVTCSRDQVLAIAEESARHGGRVVLSEAVGLAAELGPGWRQVQLRGGRKPEWVTLYGCGAGVEHGRLFAGSAA